MNTCLLTITLLFSFFLTNCGKYREKYIKNYQIAIQTDDNLIKNQVLTFIEEFNEKVGFKTLSIATHSSAANSIMYHMYFLIEGTTVCPH